MTLKVETVRRAHRTILRLIGQLGSELLEELKGQIGAAGSHVVLDMQEVTLVDLEVVRFLIDCEAQNIELCGCSPYIREWIKQERQNQK